MNELEKKILWQCRRGLWELDAILIPFVERNFSNLKEKEIENFKKLSVFKSFEKCENLNKIIEESLSKLKDFRDIDINFKVWKMKIQFDFEIEKVSELDIYTFRKYKWYSDQVMA